MKCQRVIPHPLPPPSEAMFVKTFVGSVFFRFKPIRQRGLHQKLHTIHDKISDKVIETGKGQKVKAK